MTDPLLVSVVVETITARYDALEGTLADNLGAAVAAIEKQTWPRAQIEVLVVLDDEITPETAAELELRYPNARFVRSEAANYFSAKNGGARAAKGSIVVLLDGDCEPSPDWLETIVARFQPGVDVVSGRTRYAGSSLLARTFSVPDFANVLGDENGAASGFNLNNVAFRREVLLAHPLDARIRRNGGCYLLYNQLRTLGKTIVYEPGACVTHGLDIRGLGFARKHFDRGYDSVSVYHCDERGVLRGTPLVRRFGILALPPIVLRRLVQDWIKLVRERRQIGISLPAVSYFAAVQVMTRAIELAGAMFAYARK